MFAWTEAFEWIEHGLHRRYAARACWSPWRSGRPSSLPPFRMRWSLFLALLLHPRRDRKSLSYTGGIQVSGLDFGFPCPYGALESYLTKDGRRVMTRDPGDEHQERFPGADPAQVLDCAEKPCSEPLMRCLHAVRLLSEDAARTLEELQLWGNPLLLRVTREIDGRRVSCKSCPTLSIHKDSQLPQYCSYRPSRVRPLRKRPCPAKNFKSRIAPAATALQRNAPSICLQFAL